MLRGIFQRAIPAILLMASLLAPMGICLQPAHKAAHSCCAHALQTGNSLQRDCCTVRNSAPVAVVPAVTTAPAPMIVAVALVCLREVSSQRELLAVSTRPPHSPPERISILRI